MFSDQLLAGKRVLVTGGGTGLGASIASRLAELGADIIVCGRRGEILEAFCEKVKGEVGRAAVCADVCDIRDPEAVEAMLTRIWKQSPLDCLVNNAAASFIARTERLSHRAADAILRPTMNGALYCTIGVGRRWIDAGRGGTILSMLSTSTRTGRAFTVPSAMAKSALLAMTRSLAVEWGPKGIRSVAIAPGSFPTPGSERGLNPGAARAGQQRSSLNPLGRAGEHRELANLAAYLLSDQAAYINGESIAIDGGLHLRTSGAEDLLHWTNEQWEAI